MTDDRFDIWAPKARTLALSVGDERLPLADLFKATEVVAQSLLSLLGGD